jgi:hypothetical protein
MKDKKLFAAVLILIVLMIWLLVISYERQREINRAFEQIRDVREKILSQPELRQPTDGKTPVLGVDYFNGEDGKDGQSKVVHEYTPASPGKDGDSAYDIALKNGFQGTESQWLESLKVRGDAGKDAAELDIDCVDGRLVKKYSHDVFYQLTNIKCEVSDE